MVTLKIVNLNQENTLLQKSLHFNLLKLLHSQLPLAISLS